MKQPKPLTRRQKIRLSEAIKKLNKSYDVKEFSLVTEDKDGFTVIRRGHTFQMTIPY